MLPKIANDTIAIIGGGPSLKGFDWAPLKAIGWPIITVNNAWKLFPQALIGFFADARWWRLNGATMLEGFEGRIMTAAPQQRFVEHIRLTHLRREYNAPLGLAPDLVAGMDSGTMAVNLAYHLGARRIVLFGMDMTYEGDSHWHKEHVWETTPERYEQTFAPVLIKMIEALRQRGVSVIRATQPGVDAAPYHALDFHNMWTYPQSKALA